MGPTVSIREPVDAVLAVACFLTIAICNALR